VALERVLAFVWALCSGSLLTTLPFYCIANRFFLTTHVRQFRCLNSITLPNAPPKGLGLTRFDSLFLGNY